MGICGVVNTLYLHAHRAWDTGAHRYRGTCGVVNTLYLHAHRDTGAHRYRGTCGVVNTLYLHAIYMLIGPRGRVQVHIDTGVHVVLLTLL